MTQPLFACRKTLTICPGLLREAVHAHSTVELVNVADPRLKLYAMAIQGDRSARLRNWRGCWMAEYVEKEEEGRKEVG